MSSDVSKRRRETIVEDVVGEHGSSTKRRSGASDKARSHHRHHAHPHRSKRPRIAITKDACVQTDFRESEAQTILIGDDFEGPFCVEVLSEVAHSSKSSFTASHPISVQPSTPSVDGFGDGVRRRGVPTRVSGVDNNMWDNYKAAKRWRDENAPAQEQFATDATYVPNQDIYSAESIRMQANLKPSSDTPSAENDIDDGQVIECVEDDSNWMRRWDENYKVVKEAAEAAASAAVAQTSKESADELGMSSAQLHNYYRQYYDTYYRSWYEKQAMMLQKESSANNTAIEGATTHSPTILMRNDGVTANVAAAEPQDHSFWYQSTQETDVHDSFSQQAAMNPSASAEAGIYFPLQNRKQIDDALKNLKSFYSILQMNKDKMSTEEAARLAAAQVTQQICKQPASQTLQHQQQINCVTHDPHTGAPIDPNTAYFMQQQQYHHFHQSGLYYATDQQYTTHDPVASYYMDPGQHVQYTTQLSQQYQQHRVASVAPVNCGSIPQLSLDQLGAFAKQIVAEMSGECLQTPQTKAAAVGVQPGAVRVSAAPVAYPQQAPTALAQVEQAKAWMVYQKSAAKDARIAQDERASNVLFKVQQEQQALYHQQQAVLERSGQFRRASRNSSSLKTTFATYEAAMHVVAEYLPFCLMSPNQKDVCTRAWTTHTGLENDDSTISSTFCGVPRLPHWSNIGITPEEAEQMQAGTYQHVGMSNFGYSVCPLGLEDEYMAQLIRGGTGGTGLLHGQVESGVADSMSSGGVPKLLDMKLEPSRRENYRLQSLNPHRMSDWQAPPQPPPFLQMEKQAMINDLVAHLTTFKDDVFRAERDPQQRLQLSYKAILENAVMEVLGLNVQFVFGALHDMSPMEQRYYGRPVTMRLQLCEIMIGGVFISQAGADWKIGAHEAACRLAFKMMMKPVFVVGGVRSWRDTDYLTLCLSEKDNLIPDLPPFLSDPNEPLWLKNKVLIRREADRFREKKSKESIFMDDNKFRDMVPRPLKEFWLLCGARDPSTIDDPVAILLLSGRFSNMLVSFEVEVLFNGLFNCALFVDHQYSGYGYGNTVEKAKNFAARSALMLIWSKHARVRLLGDLTPDEDPLDDTVLWEQDVDLLHYKVYVHGEGLTELRERTLLEDFGALIEHYHVQRPDVLEPLTFRHKDFQFKWPDFQKLSLDMGLQPRVIGKERAKQFLICKRLPITLFREIILEDGFCGRYKLESAGVWIPKRASDTRDYMDMWDGFGESQAGGDYFSASNRAAQAIQQHVPRSTTRTEEEVVTTTGEKEQLEESRSVEPLSSTNFQEKNNVEGEDGALVLDKEEFIAWGGLVEPELEAQPLKPLPLPEQRHSFDQTDLRRSNCHPSGSALNPVTLEDNENLEANDGTAACRDPDLPPLEEEKPWLPSHSSTIPGLFEDD